MLVFYVKMVCSYVDFCFVTEVNIFKEYYCCFIFRWNCIFLFSGFLKILIFIILFFEVLLNLKCIRFIYW